MNVLLASILLVQERTADETFRKIEDTIINAKIIRVVSSWEAAKKGKAESKRVGKGTLMMGPMVIGEWQQFIAEGRTINKYLLSNGKKLSTTVDEDSKYKDLPKNLRAKILTGVARVGPQSSQFFPGLSFDNPWDEEVFNPEAAVPVSDIVFGPSEGERKSLIYHIKFKVPEVTLTVTLWYDPKSLRLFKHTIDFGDGPDAGMSSETYEDYVVDPAITAEKFADQFAESQSRSHVEITKGTLGRVAEALDRFKLQHGRYPMRLRDLVAKPDEIDANDWPAEGYLKKLPQDSWSRDLVYRVPGIKGRSYDLLSLGMDGREGGEGFDADIWSHATSEKK
jgi:general secretion pathway protein G